MKPSYLTSSRRRTKTKESFATSSTVSSSPGRKRREDTFTRERGVGVKHSSGMAGGGGGGEMMGAGSKKQQQEPEEERENAEEEGGGRKTRRSSI